MFLKFRSNFNNLGKIIKFRSNFNNLGKKFKFRTTSQARAGCGGDVGINDYE